MANIGLVLNKLAQFATNEANLLFGLDDEIGSIKIKLEWLGLFLADAAQNQRCRQNQMLRIWMNQLREVAYDMEDELDVYTVNLDWQRMGIHSLRASPWLHCCSSPTTQLVTPHELAYRIRKIKARLEEIESTKATFLDPVDMSSPSSTDSRINILRTEVEEEPIGQNTYIEKLIPQILESNAQSPVIIPIFGMGGLGKTTLANRLYNDRDVVSHFNLRAWLTISQTCTFVDLLRSLMEQLEVQGDTSNEDEMKTKLKDHLNKKSLIIVLDDMWDISSWVYLKTIFPRQHEGITVLLTTRNKMIATDVNPDGEPFELQPLEHEESWELFCKKAFADANCPEHFLVFKKAVIERSKGLPLAILVLAGTLRGRKDWNQWKKILDQSRWEEDEVVSILYLSYDYLPHYLKACFLYVAGYPKDYVIDAQALKLMWIAEGFTQQQRGQTMEDSAEEYLQDLIQRSLIQLVERDPFGHVSMIRVHGFVHEVARKEAKEINFFSLKTQDEQSSKLARRLSLCDDNDTLNYLQYYPVSKLRSLRIQCNGERIEIPSTFNFHSMKVLRVLILRGVKLQYGNYGKAIGKLTQLRYLGFDDTNIEKLSDCISNLVKLQTLDIKGTKITQLPKKIWEIATLRHAICDYYVEINPPSKEDVSKLDELQTVQGRPNYEWMIKDGMHKLTNIKKLGLYGVFTLERQNIDIGKVKEKVLDAVDNLKHLTFLILHGEVASIKILTASNNTSLQHLILQERRRYGEEMRNSALLLPNLHTLELTNMSLTEDEMDVVGLLPKLKSLIIEDELKRLVFKEGYFSSLKELHLRTCSQLESWEVKSTAMLQLFQIGWCPRLILLPQWLQVKKIQLWYQQQTNEVKSWAKLMSESSTKTVVINVQP